MSEWHVNGLANQESLAGTARGVFNQISKGVKRNIAASIFALSTLFGANALASNYDIYFPVNPNVQNEIVLTDNVVNETQYVQGGSLVAYDMNGTELDRKWIDLGLKSAFNENIEVLFPEINLNDVSYMRFGSDTRVDGWIIQSTGDGEKNAMQQVPHELVSKIDVPHITINPYWDNELVIAKTTSNGTPEMLINPDAVVVKFDGTANNEINLIAPDMTPTGSLVYAGDIGSLLRNSSLPSDDVSKYWLEITNKTENNTPLGSSETLEENIMGLLSFFNPSSGGAFTPTVASNIITFSHVTINYWYTGFALANPGETDATVKLIYFSNDGQAIGESETYTIAPKAKLVDIARNLGAPLDSNGEFNGYAIAISDQPIYGFELFGPMNHNSMAGVRAQAGLSGALFYEFDRDNPRILGAIIPYVKSDSEHWTGIGFLNNYTQFQRYLVKAEKMNGEIVAETTLDVAPGAKKALLVRDLFPDIDTTEINHLHIYGSTSQVNSNSNFSQNYAPIVFSLTGNESHTQLVGVTPVSNAPMEARLLGLQNLTRDSVDKLASLEQLVKERTFTTEDNDTIKFNLYGILKEIGKLNGVDINDIISLSLHLYDDNNQKIGVLGDIGFGASGQGYEAQGFEEVKIENRNSPYGDSKVILELQYTDQGVSHIARIDPNITYRNNPEKDYDIDALKGEGWSYARIKEDPEGFVDLLVQDGAWYMGTTQITESNRDALVQGFRNWTDGEPANGELVNADLDDFSTIKQYAGKIVLTRTDPNVSEPFTETIDINSERTTYELSHDIFKVR